MLLPLRCCPACVSSGPSRLSPAFRRRIPRTLYQHDLTTQTRFKASDARRQRRAAAKSDSEANTSPSSTSNGVHVQKNGSSSRVPEWNRTFVSVRETEDVPLSYRAIDGLSKTRGRLAGNNRNSSASSNSLNTEDQTNTSARIPRTRSTSTSDPSSSSSSNDNPSDSSQTPLKSKLFKWLKWPISNSSSSSPSSSTDHSPGQHPESSSSTIPQTQRGSNKVFQELLQGALLSSNSNSNSNSNPAGAQVRDTRNTKSDKSVPEPEVEPEVVVDRELRELGEGEVEVDESERVRQMDLLQEVAEEHEREAGIKSYQLKETIKKGRIGLQHGRLSAKEIEISEVKPVRDVPVATLKRGLSRVLFNPSVHFTRDPRSHVYNFDTSLEHVPQADQFAYHRLPQYITASEDEDLYELVKRTGMKYYGSTSTLTKALSQIYFHISGARPISLDKLSQAFANERTDFPAGAKLPAMLWVKTMPDGKYAVDNDKRWDIDENILSDLGRVMEKMVTSDEKEMNRFMLSSPESGVSEEERNAREAYRYCKGSKILMRSQLDCYDERLPGSGTFDIKTRAAMVIRHDRANYEENSAYDVYKLTGLENSFEKEFYDMCRSAFLKYSMQVRIGGMDGIFVVYHNTARIFGYQYVSLAEMDEILHGCAAMGDQAFKLSVSLLEKLLEEATALYPYQTINLVVDASQGSELLAFVTPKTDEPVETAPVVRLKISVINKLDGQKVVGPVDFESINPRNPSSVKWTIEYEIEKTTMDEEGHSLARRGLQTARKKYTNMTSLNLPTGKTAEDMNLAALEPEEEVLVNENEIKLSTDSTVEKEKEEKMAVTKWKNPDGRILALRRLAKASGKEYEERLLGTRGKEAVVWKP